MYELEQKRLIERVLRDLSAGRSEQETASDLRLVVEPSIAALAAQRVTAADLLRLRDVLDASTDDLRSARSLELDLEFHLLLSQAAQNPLVSTLHALMTEWTMPVRKHSHRRKSGRRNSVEGHRRIYAAVAAHDPDAARAAMEAHLGDVRQLVAGVIDH